MLLSKGTFKTCSIQVLSKAVQEGHFMKIPFKVFRGIAFAAVFLALLFVPAGTLRWTEAWIFIGLYTVLTTVTALWIRFKDPELFKERSSFKKDTKTWDKIIIFLYIVGLMGLLAVAGLDAVRFHWSHVPVWKKVIGFAGFIPASLIVFAATRHNTYLSQGVRIQKERGHQVCTTGPYRIVRHPMYSGIILLIACLPLALGSLFAFIPAFVIVCLFILRTILEDQTLKSELEGYREYAARVRFKLIPGIW